MGVRNSYIVLKVFFIALAIGITKMIKLHLGKISLGAYIIFSYRSKISILHISKHTCLTFTGAVAQILSMCHQF